MKDSRRADPRTPTTDLSPLVGASVNFGVRVLEVAVPAGRNFLGSRGLAAQLSQSDHLLSLSSFVAAVSSVEACEQDALVEFRERFLAHDGGGEPYRAFRCSGSPTPGM